MAQFDFNVSWKIYVEAPEEFSLTWKIQNSEDFSTTWTIAYQVILDFPISWYRVTYMNPEFEWKISSILDFTVEWKNTPRVDLETEWKIPGTIINDIEWKIGTHYYYFETEWKNRIIIDLYDSEWLIKNGYEIETKWILYGVIRKCSDYLTDWSIIAVKTLGNYVVSDFIGRKSNSAGKTISEIIYDSKTLSNIDDLSLAEILNKHIGN